MKDVLLEKIAPHICHRLTIFVATEKGNKMSKRIIEIEISCCGDCPYYDYKKHRCSKGAVDEGEPTDSFYADCPLTYIEFQRERKQNEQR